MNKIKELYESMLIKRKDGLCLGEVWHNKRMELLFKDVKYSKFNYDLLLWIKDTITQNYHESEDWIKKYGDNYGKITMNSSDNLTKGQIKKLNSILKSKSKNTLKKRIYNFSEMLVNSYYQSIFHTKRNKSWIEFCNKYNLETGLIKTTRQEQMIKTINNMLGE